MVYIENWLYKIIKKMYTCIQNVKSEFVRSTAILNGAKLSDQPAVILAIIINWIQSVYCTNNSIIIAVTTTLLAIFSIIITAVYCVVFFLSFFLVRCIVIDEWQFTQGHISFDTWYMWMWCQLLTKYGNVQSTTFNCFVLVHIQ